LPWSVVGKKYVRHFGDQINLQNVERLSYPANICLHKSLLWEYIVRIGVSLGNQLDLLGRLCRFSSSVITLFFSYTKSKERSTKDGGHVGALPSADFSPAPSFMILSEHRD
jgi:hypothetical protein